MQMNLQSGSAQVSAPLLAAQLHAALVTVLRTVDGHFQSIKTEIPRVPPGNEELVEFFVATRSSLGAVRAEVVAAQREIEGEINRAKSVIDQADRYTDLLASISAHITAGSPIRHESVAPDMADAGKLLRRSFLVGDADGLARKTADVLLAESEDAAGYVATAADAVRKLAGAIRVGMHKQKMEVYARLRDSADAPHAAVTEREKQVIGNAANAEATHYSAYRDGYIKVYQTRGAEARLPNLKCLARLEGRINRTNKGIRILPPEVN